MTEIATATGTNEELGPLTKQVYKFVEAQTRARLAGIKSPADWDQVTEFVAVDEFKRVGAYLEELNWAEYSAFLTGWASGGTEFEFTEFHISEVGNAVFQEIEERHHRGDQLIKKNVIAVYRFTPEGKIRHLDIYEQARESGDWIRDAATAATKSA